MIDQAEKRRVFRLARLKGYRVVRKRVVGKRGEVTPENRGKYMLIDNRTGVIVMGDRYSAELHEIEQYLTDEERSKSSRSMK
jgi:hypothetical protein